MEQALGSWDLSLAVAQGHVKESDAGNCDAGDGDRPPPELPEHRSRWNGATSQPRGTEGPAYRRAR